MTNEEILEMFLKKHRKFKSFLEQQHLDEEHIVNVLEAINYNFYWDETNEGYVYWNKMSAKWQKLCREFKLKGNVILDSYTR